jgi:acyl-coenzyme A thioesterase PaaI-like protein
VKPINVTVDFMRSGTVKDTFASGEVTRLGRRMANVLARAWQDDRGKPIASAHMNVLIRTSALSPSREKESREAARREGK